MWLKIVCLWYPNWTYIFNPSQACGRLWQGFQFCSYTCHHQFIDLFQWKHLKVFLLSYFSHCFSSGISIDSKTSLLVVTVWWFKTVVGITVAQRDTNSHRVNPLRFVLSLYIGYSVKRILIYKHHNRIRHLFKRCIDIKVCLIGKSIQ